MTKKTIELANGTRISLNDDEYLVSYLPGMSALGCGYDVNGRFASNRSVKNRVVKFDYGSWPKFQFGRLVWWPSNIEIQSMSIQESDFQQVSGNNVNEYRQSLNSKTKLKGRYKFFTGSLESDFNYSSIRDSSNEFYTLRYVQNSWSLGLPGFPDVEIDERARRDINGETGMQPSDLFNKYGTHIVVKLYTGGRLDYSLSLDRNKYRYDMDFRIAAKFSFDKIIGSISPQNETKYAEQIEAIQELSTINVQTLGGNEGYASSILTKGKEAFGEWGASVKEAPVFMDFDESSLVPLWTICETEARKEELRHYYANLMRGISDTPIAKAPFESRTISGENLKNAGADLGSHADKDLTVFKPQDSFIDDGWFWFGHYGQGNHENNPSGTLVLIKPNESLDEPVVVPPSGYTKVWQHKAGGKYYTCWEPSSKDDSYVPLGHIMDLDAPPRYKDTPNPFHTQGLCCINIKYARAAALNRNDLIWNDDGSGAKEDISLYTIKQKGSGSRIVGTFIGVSDSFPEPNVHLLSLI